MEDFVTFEIAKKLKEKGFREDCIAYYHTDGELIYNRDEYRGGDYKSLLNSYNSLPKNPIGCEQIDAPTISQVLKWLREGKKFVISILPASFDKTTSLSNYYYVVYNIKEYFWDRYEYPQSFGTYEECELRAIEYVLDNLI